MVKALQAADEALMQDAAGSSGDSAGAPGKRKREQSEWVQRQADALTLAAETFLAHGAHGLPAGERQLMTVHVDVTALATDSDSAGAPGDAETDETRCHLHDGPALARDVVRRFACDASVVALLENERGEVLDVGRKTRAIPPALRRALEHRDQGCRFPGCLCTRFVDAHHIEHWVDGGATSIDNLVLLCRHHHRLVHEGGFSLAMQHGDVVVRRPNGGAIERSPATNAPTELGLDVIRRTNDERGLEIDARTGIPGWGGEHADYDYLVAMLGDRDAGRHAINGDAR